jgi:hypothetical protein
MGITVSPATAASGGGGGTSLPVVPGTSVEQEIYTDIGFATGDYVYRYGSGSVGVMPPISAANFKFYVSASVGFSQGGGLPSAYDKSVVIAPQTRGTSYTYTGATYTVASQFQAPAVIRAENSTHGIRIARLSNGNLVTVFNGNTASGTLSTLYFRIFTNNNTQIATGIVDAAYMSATGVTYGPHYDVCATNDGGFCVVYRRASATYAAVYSAAGAVITAGFNILPSGGSFYPRIKQAPSNQFYLVSTSSVTAGTGYVNRYTSALVNVSYYDFTSPFGWSPSGEPQIAIYSTGKILVAIPNADTNIGRVKLLETLTADGSNSVGGAPNSRFCGLVPMQDGAIAVCTPSTTQSIYFEYVPSTGGTYSNTLSSPTTTTTNMMFAAAPYCGPTDGTMSSSAASSLVIYYMNAAQTAYVARIATFSGGGWSFAGSEFSTSLTSTTTSLVAIDTTTPSNALAYTISSGQPTYLLSSTIAITSGAVRQVPASDYPVPANGYYLLGVATTTAAAGTTGTIAINGLAPLSVSYGTSSTPLGFDYNPLNRAGIPNGNTGYVINRMVILKGLEQ